LFGVAISGCVTPPLHDYPNQHPVAESTGKCPDLSGTFVNTGAEVAPAGKPVTEYLTDALFHPGVHSPIASGVARVHVTGPQNSQLAVTALSDDGKIIAEDKIPQAGGRPQPSWGSFRCAEKHVEIAAGESTSVTGAGPIALFDYTRVGLELYRAKDGSLLVLHDERDTGVLVVVPYHRVKHKWWRYEQVRDAPAPTPPAQD
jgi:hypothetical protein